MPLTTDTGAYPDPTFIPGVQIDENGVPIMTRDAWVQSVVVDEVKSAKDYTEKVQSGDRMARWDRYYGRKLGNEKKGRSKFISRDIIETIEWIMPSLMSTFVSSDPKVEITIDGQDPVVGKAVMQKIQDDLNDDDERSIYILYYQWFKDALVSDTAFVSQAWDVVTTEQEVRFPDATDQHMQIINRSPDVRLDAYTDNGDGTYSDVDVTVTTVDGEKVDVRNLPHWDVIVDPNARFINDEYGKGYKSKVTLDYLIRTNEQYRDDTGEGFFTGLETLKAHIGRSRELSDSEYTSYMDGAEEEVADIYPAGVHYTSDPKALYGYIDPKTTVEVVQWYTRVDVDGDGVLEDIKCWVGEGEVLLRWEYNDDGGIMMSALSPIIDCYKFFGIAFSELILDIQNLKTMLIRRILDNFDFSNLGRTFIRPGGRVPIKELLQNIPGDTIPMDPEHVKVEYPKPFDSRVLTLLEYVDAMKENRTGSTRYNQGTDAESLNKTAAGMSMIQQASQKRIDMVARLFAETGIRDNYKKCVTLLQRNQTIPFTVKVDGRDVTIQPEQLQGKVKCKVQLGVEAQIGMMEAEKLRAVFDFLAAVNQIFPGIIGPEQIHNLATKFVVNMGNKQPEEFVAIVDEFVQSLKVSQKQTMEAVQFERQIESQKVQVDWAKVQVLAKKNDVELKDVLLDAQTRMATKKMDIAQKDRGNRLRFMADMAKVFAQQNQARQATREVA